MENLKKDNFRIKYYFVKLLKLISFFIKKLKLGSGNTLPGFLLLKLFPNILKEISPVFPQGIVFITGTNGKTTTSKLITHLLQKQGLTVLSNTSGSNLLRGIVTTILFDLDAQGKPQSDICVLEVDEFVLPSLFLQITPQVVAFLNLSRDQLDRYGETDIVLDKWISSLKKLTSATLVVDSTQKELEKLAPAYEGDVVYFNGIPASPFYKDWSSFNIKNVNAALACVAALGVQKAFLVDGLYDFEFAYGRGEEIKNGEVSYTLFLAKNPASFNHNLEYLLKHKDTFDTLLFILNDNIPDGRDVSWIYDIESSPLQEVCLDKNIYISGTRDTDMAVRLSYAGASVTSENLISYDKNLVSPLKHAKKVVVLPNYSAMLDFRKLVLGRKIL